MTTNHPPKSNKLTWIISALCVLAGIALAAHAFLTWDQANVVVEWETASELDTVGFNLLRSESPAGPFAQINTELIPATSDTLTGSQYTYEDTNTQAGITYFYMLEEIEITGQSNQHGPINVKAQNYVKIELGVALLLLVGTGAFTWVTIRDRRRAIEGQN